MKRLNLLFLESYGAICLILPRFLRKDLSTIQNLTNGWLGLLTDLGRIMAIKPLGTSGPESLRITGLGPINYLGLGPLISNQA